MTDAPAGTSGEGRTARAKETLFGRLLVREEVISQEQLDAAVRAQQVMREQGLSFRLGEVLVRQHLLTEEQVREFLHLAGKQLLHCPKCGKNYNVKNWSPGKEVLCPACLLPLAPPSSRSARSAVDAHATQILPAYNPPIREGEHPGSYVGRYKLLEELGQEGSFVVWKAWDPGLKQVLVLRMESPAGAASAAHSSAASAFALGATADESAAHSGAAERMLRDAEAATKLKHPTIVAVRGAGTQSGRVYVVTDYATGQPLAGLRDRPVTARQALEWIGAIAEALAYAHGCGAVHGDVRPGNILIDENGTPYLTGFGLARPTRLSASSDGNDEAGELPETVRYWSPEEATSGMRQPSPVSDQFALGTLLYELLTGQPPFEGETLSELLQSVAGEEAVAPRRIQPRIHADVESICLRALEKNPQRRYADLADFAADIGHYLQGHSVEAKPVSRLRQRRRQIQRNPAAASAAIAAVLFSIGGVLWVFAFFDGKGGKVRERLEAAGRLERDGKLDEARRTYVAAQELDALSVEASEGIKRVDARLEDLAETEDVPEKTPASVATTSETQPDGGRTAAAAQPTRFPDSETARLVAEGTRAYNEGMEHLRRSAEAGPRQEEENGLALEAFRKSCKSFEEAIKREPDDQWIAAQLRQANLQRVQCFRRATSK